MPYVYVLTITIRTEYPTIIVMSDEDSDSDRCPSVDLQRKHSELLVAYNQTVQDDTAPRTLKLYRSVITRASNFFRLMKYPVFDVDGNLDYHLIAEEHISAFFADNSVHKTGKRAGKAKTKSTAESFRNAFVWGFKAAKAVLPGESAVSTKRFISSARKKSKRDLNSGLEDSNARNEVTMKENEVNSV